MTSSGREFLKWIALLLMTGDHLVKIFDFGYVPVLSELGRVAFPLFAFVMAYNLAQPGVHAGRVCIRLAIWGAVATPVAYWAFHALLPLNVLLTFSCAAAVIWACQRRQWMLAALLGFVVPMFLDYSWPGVWLVVAAWGWFSNHGTRMHFLLGSWDWRRHRLYLVLPVWVGGCMALLCWYNGNAWALLAVPLLMLAEFQWRITRAGRFFYVYYVGHLALLAAFAAFAGV